MASAPIERDPTLDIENKRPVDPSHHTPNKAYGEPVYPPEKTYESPITPQETSNGHQVTDDLAGKRQDSLDREEKGATVGNGSAESGSVSEKRVGRFRRFYRRYKYLFHLFIWLFFTGWFIAGVVLHRNDIGWLIPFLLYLCITIRLVTLYVPITIVTKPMHFVWNNTGVKFAELIPERFRIWCGAALTIAVIVVGSFASPESQGNTRANRAVSLFGLVVLITVLWATSANRKAIQWHTVIVGMLIQFLVALFVLRTKVGYDIFEFVSFLARSLLHFAAEGVKFLTTKKISEYKFFFFSVLPAIVFFISLTSLLFYCGALQWFIGKFAVFFFLEYESIWCRSGRCLCITIHRTRRISHAH